MADRELENRKLGLPIRPFMYTIDQVAGMLAFSSLSQFKANYCFFDGIHTVRRPSNKLFVNNINPQGSSPEWRITERELVRWLRYMGFRVIEPTRLSTQVEPS